MSTDKPALEDGESRISEAFAPCDCCEDVFWWDTLVTGDDGETWVCPECRDALIATAVRAASTGDSQEGNDE
jgi:hypothetical protein